MDTEIFQAIQNISLESLIISFGIFILTELIKWPIKKCTQKLTEEKRKAVNLIIILIPIFLSFIACIIYFGLSKGTWFSWNMIQTSISSWVLSMSLYAIYSKIVIIIKGVISGKIKINDQATKQAISKIKDEISTITSKLKLDGKTLKAVQEKIDIVEKTKKLLEESVGNLNISKLSQTNIELKSLEDERNRLMNSVEISKSDRDNYLELLKGAN